MREYELILIINPELDDTETESLIERVKSNIESNGGEALKVDAWGRKPLAFPIKKNNEGYYALFIFRSDPAFVPQLSNSFRVIESIIRHMVVLFEGDLDKVISLKEDSVPREADTHSALEREDEENSPVTDSEGVNNIPDNQGEDQAEEAVPDNS